MSEQQFSQGMAPSLQDGSQFGAPHLLRQTREAAGLHIAALAAALKVPVRKLEALEAGRYDELPDLTFARALASSACRQLKVDPSAVLEQIPQATRQALGDSQDAINAPFKSANNGASMGVLAWLKRPTVLIVLALALGALALVLLPDRFLSIFPETADTVSTETSAIESGPVLEPAADPGVATAGLTLSMTSPTVSAPSADVAPENPTDEAVVPAADSTATESAGPDRSSSKSLLKLSATGESWIEVVNGSGGVLMQRVLKPGDVVDFSSTPPYSVVLGRAEAVQVLVRGKPFDVMPYARNNVARFEVK